MIDWENEPRRMLRQVQLSMLTEFLLMDEPEWPGNVINIADYLDKNVVEEEKLAGIKEPTHAMTSHEIGEELGISYRTVERIIHDALEKLRSRVKSEDMLYYGENTNFFNPNHGGESWRSIQSLLQG